MAMHTTALLTTALRTTALLTTALLRAAHEEAHDGLGRAVGDGSLHGGVVRGEDGAEQPHVQPAGELLHHPLQLGEECGVVCGDVGLLHAHELVELELRHGHLLLLGLRARVRVRVGVRVWG